MLPVSGWLVSRYGNGRQQPLSVGIAVALLVYICTNIPVADSVLTPSSPRKLAALEVNYGPDHGIRAEKSGL